MDIDEPACLEELLPALRRTRTLPAPGCDAGGIPCDSHNACWPLARNCADLRGDDPSIRRTKRQLEHHVQDDKAASRTENASRFGEGQLLPAVVQVMECITRDNDVRDAVCDPDRTQVGVDIPDALETCGDGMRCDSVEHRLAVVDCGYLECCSRRGQGEQTRPRAEIDNAFAVLDGGETEHACCKPVEDGRRGDALPGFNATVPGC